MCSKKGTTVFLGPSPPRSAAMAWLRAVSGATAAPPGGVWPRGPRAPRRREGEVLGIDARTKLELLGCHEKDNKNRFCSMTCGTVYKTCREKV